MQGQLPNLILIGAMKCGTTSLHAYLDQHPDIFMSRKKELDYFVTGSENHGNLDWYKDQFKSDCKVRGESSQSYTKCHAKQFFGVPSRIHEKIPDVKLIYVVRDPVERIKSHYIESVSGDNQTLSFLDFIGYPDEIRNNTFVQTGNYFLQLQEYLKYFQMNQIHVLALEDLQRDRLGTLNKVFEFLGVDTLSDASVFNFTKNEGNQKTVLNPLGKLLGGSKISQLLLRTSLGQNIRKLYKSEALVSLSTKRVYKAEITAEEAARIREAVAEDISKFKELVGRTFSNWSL